MANSDIIVFGGRGQVGSALQAARPQTITALGRDQVDLTDPAAISTVIEKIKPACVINAAAYTAVDKAETEPEVAELVNTRAPLEMARACERTGACLIHYSTDYVFDGTASRPYREQDQTGPLGVYGKTKLAGEQAVMDNLQRHIILRTAWVYDQNGSNFVNTMLRLGRDPDRRELSVVADQRGSPTYAPDLARATLDIVDRLDGATENPWGIYHATGAGETTWHGFAESIFEMADIEIQVNPITTAEYPTPAPRPAYSVLDNERLRMIFDVALPQWPDALSRCLRDT